MKVQRRNLESKRNNRGELQQDESTKPPQSINLDSSNYVSAESLHGKSSSPQKDEFAEYVAARQRIWMTLRKSEVRSQCEVVSPSEDGFSKPFHREPPKLSRGESLESQKDEFAEYAAARQRTWVALRKSEAHSQREVGSPFESWLSRSLSGEASRTSQDKFYKKHEDWNCSNIGKRGEDSVYSILESSFPNISFIRNVYLRTETNSLTEIDLIGISDKGIFVFECKTYNGDVYGTDKKRDWYVYYPSGKNYSFYSPVLQNESHMKAILRRIPWLRPNELHSVIVFAGSGCVKVLSSVPVISASSLVPDFKRLESSLPPVLDVHEIQSVYNCLKLFSNPPDDAKREHIRHVSEVKRKYSS